MPRPRPREILESALAVLGLVLILAPVVWVAHAWTVVALVVVGLLLLEAGTWGLARRVLPEDRVYTRLREEVERFLEEVRILNRRAAEGDREALERSRDRLHDRVDRLAEAAGRAEGGEEQASE